MEISGQLHAHTASPPWKRTPVSNEQKRGLLQSQSGYSGAETKHIQTAIRCKTSISY